MIDEKMDYHFGWRWLLPLNSETQVMFVGFTDEEIEFWCQKLPTGARITNKAEKANLWLVNGAPPNYLELANIDNLNDICVIGSGKVIGHWTGWAKKHSFRIWEYAMLPPVDARVIVPLYGRDLLNEGLSLHQPGRKLIRLAVNLLKGLALLGFDLPLRKKMICLCSKNETFDSYGATQAGIDLRVAKRPKNYALYLGTPNENRKTVILPLGAESNTILKYGSSSVAKASLRNEASTLQEIGRTSLVEKIPKLIEVVDTDNQVTLHLEYRVRKKASDRWLAGNVKTFLSMLSQQNKSRKTLAEVLESNALLTSENELEQKSLKHIEVVREYLCHLASEGEYIWGHRSHGDLTPWNCSRTQKGFFVYDWEKSKPWDIALSDSFYYSVAPAIHISGPHDSARVETMALLFAKKNLKSTNLSVNIPVLWGIWLLQRMSEKPTTIYNNLLVRLADLWQKEKG